MGKSQKKFGREMKPNQNSDKMETLDGPVREMKRKLNHSSQVSEAQIGNAFNSMDQEAHIQAQNGPIRSPRISTEMNAQPPAGSVSTVNKPNLKASIKGKKAIMRSRALCDQSLEFIEVDQSTLYPKNQVEKLVTHDAANQASYGGEGKSDSKGGSISRASFELQFSSMSCPEVGYQFRERSNRKLSSGFGRDSCDPSQENGVVERGASESLEDLGDDKDHMVAFYDGDAFADGGAEPSRAKGIGKASNTILNSSPNDCVQLPSFGASDGDGCISTYSDDESGRRADEGSAEADQMEFEGKGEVLATL